MHSHGWGGSRTTDPAAFQQWLRRGLRRALLRPARLRRERRTRPRREPGFEGHDVRAPDRAGRAAAWVQQDGPGDPRLGAIGGSYGGGYQFLGAFESLRTPRQAGLRRARPRDHLVRPQPEPRARGRGAHRVGARAERRRGCRPTRCRRRSTRRSSRARPPAPGPTARSPAPRTCVPFFRSNGPKWHVDHGRRLDIPVLFGPGHHRLAVHPPAGPRQLAHGAHRRRPAGRASSSATTAATCCRRSCPPGVNVTSDPCSERARRRRLRRPRAAVHGREAQGARHRPARLRHATTSPPPTARCTTVELGRRPTRASTSARSPPPRRSAPRCAYPVAEGPIRIAGSPYLTGTADRPRRQQPRVLRPRGRHHARRRPPGPEQRAAARRAATRSPASAAGSRCRRSPSTYRRARRSTCIASAGQRHVRRHGQPHAGRGPDRGHGGAPPRRGRGDRPSLRRCPLASGLLLVALGLCPRRHRAGDLRAGDAGAPGPAEQAAGAPAADQSDQPGQTSDGMPAARSSAPLPRPARVPAAAGPRERGWRIAPGVTYRRWDQTDRRGPIRAPPDHGRPGRSRASRSTTRRGATSPSRGPLDRAARAATSAVAGVNGGFFDIDDTGAPLGVGLDRQRGFLHAAALHVEQRLLRSPATGAPRIGPITMQREHRRAPAARDHQRELPARPRGPASASTPAPGAGPPATAITDGQRRQRPDGRDPERPGRRATGPASTRDSRSTARSWSDAGRAPSSSRSCGSARRRPCAGGSPATRRWPSAARTCCCATAGSQVVRRPRAPPPHRRRHRPRHRPDPAARRRRPAGLSRGYTLVELARLMQPARRRGRAQPRRRRLVDDGRGPQRDVRRAQLPLRRRAAPDPRRASACSYREA